MNSNDYLDIESQSSFCTRLAQELSASEAFILVSGEGGSGRSAVLEKIVSDKNTQRVVFIPCAREMTLVNLREIVLSQLFGFGQEKFDYTLNLADTIIKHKVPTREKILFAIDDIDLVISAFFDELVALSDDFLGQRRFSFVASCQSVFAASKIRSFVSSKTAIREEAVPLLSAKESFNLCRHIFYLNGLIKVFNRIEGKVPEMLLPCKGNLSALIDISEKLMREPQKTPEAVRARGKKPMPHRKEKKSGATGIFISILCIAIVLACLVPIFMGSDFFSDNTRTQESSSAMSPNSQALESTASRPILDDGILQPDVPHGVDTDIPQKTTEHEIVVDGKDLEQIEGAGSSNPDYPRAGLAGSSVNEINKTDVAAADAAVPAAPDVTDPVYTELKRNDNVLRKDEIAKAKEEAKKAPLRDINPNDFAKSRQEQTSAGADSVKSDAKDEVKPSLIAPEAADAKKTDRLEIAGLNKTEPARDLPETQNAGTETAKTPAGTQNTGTQTAVRSEAPKPAPVRTEAKAVAGIVKPVAPKLQAGVVKPYVPSDNSAARTPSNAVVSPETVPYTGKAVPGDMAELRAKPDNHYTVQIVAGNQRQKVIDVSAGLSDKYWVYEKDVNGKRYYVLISGDYPSSAAASAAITRLPQTLKSSGPFVKRFRTVKREMK